jgi:hypothetical protein
MEVRLVSRYQAAIEEIKNILKEKGKKGVNVEDLRKVFRNKYGLFSPSTRALMVELLSCGMPVYVENEEGVTKIYLKKMNHDE